MTTIYAQKTTSQSPQGLMTSCGFALIFSGFTVGSTLSHFYALPLSLMSALAAGVLILVAIGLVALFVPPIKNRLSHLQQSASWSRMQWLLVPLYAALLGLLTNAPLPITLIWAASSLAIALALVLTSHFTRRFWQPRLESIGRWQGRFGVVGFIGFMAMLIAGWFGWLRLTMLLIVPLIGLLAVLFTLGCVQMALNDQGSPMMLASPVAFASIGILLISLAV